MKTKTTIDNVQQSFPVVHTDKDKFFTFVERKEEDVIICVGNQIVSSHSFKTWQAAKEYTKKKPWELLVNVMCVINQKMKSYEETTQE